MIVNLEPWEYEHANRVGIGRYVANWFKNDAAHYDRSRMQDDRTAQVAAAVCELAVAKHLNQYWPGSVWSPSQHDYYRLTVDVGVNIEVRRVRTRDSVAIRLNDLGRGLEVWAARAIEPELRQVELLGHIGADRGYDMGKASSFSDTRYVPLLELLPP